MNPPKRSKSILIINYILAARLAYKYSLTIAIANLQIANASQWFWVLSGSMFASVQYGVVQVAMVERF